jgi:2-dehydro-3-deoxyphosphogluconate aldolase/(4S)-4-hydroxy-2-oxoglutarate aldolase
MPSHTMERILKKKLLPAVIIHDANDALPLADAMLAAGLDIVEITFRTPAAEESIKRIASRHPHMLVGAGTVLSADQVKRAAAAGGKFTVSPGFNPAIAALAGDLRILHIPGTVTPTEIEAAMWVGCKLLKFFPADAMGGAKTLKALAGPYAHTGVKFLPTGGINSVNAAEFLALPIVGAVGGSWMVAEKLIKERKWPEVTRLCMESVSVCASSSNPSTPSP